MHVFQCDGIIFDLDGVLVDSSLAIKRHWFMWAKKHGINPEESLHATLGLTTIEGIRLIAPHLNAEVEADEIDNAEAADAEGVVAYDGVIELLDTIPNGWWGVATSGTRDTAVARMRNAGLMIPITLISANDVIKGKPEPEPYLLAAQRLNLQPDRCLVVEDSVGGVRAGLAAGMQVIGVASTHKLDELGLAHAIIGKMEDIKIAINDPGKESFRMTIYCQE
jgi:sugar-phosphatase